MPWTELDDATKEIFIEREIKSEKKRKELIQIEVDQFESQTKLRTENVEMNDKKRRDLAEKGRMKQIELDSELQSIQKDVDERSISIENEMYWRLVMINRDRERQIIQYHLQTRCDEKLRINKRLKELKGQKEVLYRSQKAKEDIIKRLFEIKYGEEYPYTNQFCWEQFMERGYLEQHDIKKYWTWNFEKNRMAFTLGTIGYEGRQTYKLH